MMQLIPPCCTSSSYVVVAGLAIEAAAEVGALQGKITAFESIKVEQEAKIANLRAEINTAQQSITDLTNQRALFEKQIADSSVDVSTVELLK